MKLKHIKQIFRDNQISKDQYKIVKLMPWNFIDHHKLVVKHIAWSQIVKITNRKKKWKLI